MLEPRTVVLWGIMSVCHRTPRDGTAFVPSYRTSKPTDQHQGVDAQHLTLTCHPASGAGGLTETHGSASGGGGRMSCWLDCMYWAIFWGKIFLEISNDAVQHFDHEVNWKNLLPIFGELLPKFKSVWKKICPILFQKLPKTMWENKK